MPKPYKKILVLGSGPIKIGEAGEFDYAGTQALKALQEEGIETVLLNSNLATVQTAEYFGHKRYLLPISADYARALIEIENPDAVLISFGGQTALNCAIELHEQGYFAQNNIAVLGTAIEDIKQSENRVLFSQLLATHQIKTAAYTSIHSMEDALLFAKKQGYPLMIRSSFSLGGLSSALVQEESELLEKIGQALQQSKEIVLEESLWGWKEIEYEVMRDGADNCLIVCNMENLDPVGIHTGESIVLTPSQTLNDEQYQLLRTLSIRIARLLNIVGECNVQFALHPTTGDYRVIEVNPRLSRSSALASKATGYPIAFIAAKLALGYRLDEVLNPLSGKTAFFEPALDYITCKIPRWDFGQFSGVSKNIGTSMQSIGEVMSIGTNFAEALQKALRMLDIGIDGLSEMQYSLEDIERAGEKRVLAIFNALLDGHSVEFIVQKSQIDSWFIYKIEELAVFYKELITSDLSPEVLAEAKKMGFSDSFLAQLFFKEPSNFEGIKKIRALRKEWNMLPTVRNIDSSAAEFPCPSNFLYLSYSGTQQEPSSFSKPIIVLGAGPYRIGSSVEFDSAAVETLFALKEMGHQTVMINCNPETVSTDYDCSDLLFFEELTLERILDIADWLQPLGIIVAMGGQKPLTLAHELQQHGQTILGTSPNQILRTENRLAFSNLLKAKNISQPNFSLAHNLQELHAFVDNYGFPLILRPSFVLSGNGMQKLHSKEELDSWLKASPDFEEDKPIVISQFLEEAIEFELDAIAINGELTEHIFCEHIEAAGVHSGDATLLYPCLFVEEKALGQATQIARDLALEFQISGPFNIQFLYKEELIYVIELNLRASRSLPFLSRVSQRFLLKKAAFALMSVAFQAIPPKNSVPWALKSPQFSFHRLDNIDPLLGIVMQSTGEAVAVGNNWQSPLLLSMRSAGMKFPIKNILFDITYNDWEAISKSLTALAIQIQFTQRCAYQTAAEEEEDLVAAMNQGQITILVSDSSASQRLRKVAAKNQISIIQSMKHLNLIIKALEYQKRNSTTNTPYFSIDAIKSSAL